MNMAQGGRDGDMACDTDESDGRYTVQGWESHLGYLFCTNVKSGCSLTIALYSFSS